MQSHWDGPDWSIALVRFSLSQHTPSPPGYPIYIALGKVMHFFVSDIHMAIVLVSVFFSGIGAALLFFIGKTLFGRAVGIIAALIFLSAPTMYFFGVTANPYGILPTTAAALACVVFLIVFKKKKYGLILGTVFSIAIGIRPQDVLFLSPLFLFGLFHLKTRERVWAVISFFVSFLLWFLPTAYAVGGIQKYIHGLRLFSEQGAVSGISINHLVNSWFVILRGFFLTLGVASVFLAFYFLDLLRAKKSKKQLYILFLLWIIPSLLFNAFVRSDHAAHQMAYLSGFIFLTSYAVWKTLIKHRRILVSSVAVIVLFNLYTFFRDRDVENTKPYVSQSYHNSEIRKNDTRLSAVSSFITDNYESGSTIVLVDPEIFRPVTYYLKKYRVYAYGVLDTNVVPYTDSVHFGYDWDYRFVKDTMHTLTVPKDVDTVILIPNNKPYAVQAERVMKIPLPGNAFIYSFIAKPGNRYALSVHRIEKINEK